MKFTIKDRNGMDLREAEDIKKRWKEYTEELFKKYVNLNHRQNVNLTNYKEFLEINEKNTIQ